MKWGLIVLLGGGIMVGLVLLTRLLSDSSLLTARATQVAVLPTPPMNYAWVSDHEFIMHASYPERSLLRVDTRTGARTAMAGLQKCIGKERDYGTFALSPDGTRTLWKSGEVALEILSSPLDGSSLTKRSLKPGVFWVDASDFVWMPDSRQWVQLLAGTGRLYAVVEGLDSPGIIRQNAIGIPKGTANGFDLIPTHLLGCTQTGRILATPAWYDGVLGQNPQRQINFFEFSVDGGPAQLREYTIGLPKAGKFYESDIALAHNEEVEMSPQGDRLAWIVHVMEEEPPLQKWLARWIPLFKKEPHPRIELRTSKLDGSDVRALGYLDFDPEKPPYANTNPSGLRWLPDGQRLSFIYEDAMWTISAR